MAAPAQVKTVPHHTVYGCLYIRDGQFPGGNTDTSEDPLATAHREAAEETGLSLGQ
ncbi:NUDIX domain-containing protein, partial [Streptomyces sp. NPDC002896]|uniref:NUDIX hydrolase n=1 Tax=Streptomyces sp. NPDC002896 TaxID=3154438 RepID=UPI0033264783